jgi:integrase
VTVSKKRLSWLEFRRNYRELKRFRSDGARESAEVRLDICEKLVNPIRLRDMADPTVLARLQAQLLVSRSEHTVKSYMQTLVAALNWAHQFGWLGSRVKYEAIRTTHLETHKGRPITEAEFNAMLAACDVVCAGSDPESWKFLLRGLWHSGLRLGEACEFAWDIPKKIRPLRHRSGHVVLQIPAARQKSKRDQTVPTIPDFARLLDEVPVEQRSGYVFNPQKRRGAGRYSDPKDVGRVITAIGKQAGVYVNETKPASAHDLRRSFGQRLADAGVSPRDLQAIMRHREFSTTQRFYLKDEAADQAERISRVWTNNGYGGASRTQQETLTATPEEPPQVVS